MSWKARIYIDDTEVDVREFDDAREFEVGRTIILPDLKVALGAAPELGQQVRVASVEVKIYVEPIDGK